MMEKRIELAHGAGGILMDELIKNVIIPKFSLRTAGGVGLDDLDDGASIPVGDYEIVISTDAHTVDPIFFPGGDIGKLAVAGIINDVSVMGARPIAITSAMVLEEGFPISDLEKILASMAQTAEEVGVALISGDTKVVPRGQVDKIIITTTGVGIVKRGHIIKDSGLKPGDKIIITGTIGDHGIALLAKREGLEFETELKSDVAPIWETINAALSVGGITAMKDPTRGGVAAALVDMAEKSKVSIWIEEDALPIREEVQAAAEMLGIDPLEVTNEGKAVIGVSNDKAEEVLDAIRKTKYGRNAAIIGEVKAEKPGYVLVRTSIGGTRILEKPYGEPIPRVC
ncbi:MAG: hydrogenase expression/formation protein HypE [Candidatus Baldrarchaeia archaeon]